LTSPAVITAFTNLFAPNILGHPKVSNAQELKIKSITNVIARLYGMMKGLCDLSESKDFRLFKKI